jgi:hypothetical protein
MLNETGNGRTHGSLSLDILPIAMGRRRRKKLRGSIDRGVYCGYMFYGLDHPYFQTSLCGNKELFPTGTMSTGESIRQLPRPDWTHQSHW